VGGRDKLQSTSFSLHPGHGKVASVNLVKCHLVVRTCLFKVCK